MAHKKDHKDVTKEFFKNFVSNTRDKQNAAYKKLLNKK